MIPPLPRPEVGRRDVLRLAGLAGLGALVAGCAPAADERPRSDVTTSAPTSADPTTAPSSSAPATSAAPSSSGAPAWAQLQKQLSGRLSRPGQSGFDPAALLYNPRFAGQQTPQAIAHVTNAADVAACVAFAAAGGATLRMRNGGHSYGGWSVGPGLVVDLAALKSVQVDRSAKTATIGAGALLADVYSRLGAAGVSIGAGSCPTVGVSGLTLGGGIGVLARSYGLTCDQVSSFEVVTADGKRQSVSARSQPDLFFALRGAGASFAAVTSLTFRVKPAPRVQTFYLQWPLSRAPQVLAAWQSWMADAPNELWSTCKLLTSRVNGNRVLVAGTWVGNGSPTSRVASLVNEAGAPSRRFSGGGAYADVMLTEAGCSGESASTCIKDARTPALRLPFTAGSSVLSRPLPTAGVSALADAVEAGGDVSGMVEGGVSFDALGGAVADADAGDAAFPWRSALADLQYTATWPYARAGSSPTPYARYVAAMRALVEPWTGAAAYANYADPGLKDYASAYWGSNLPRLTALKRQFDPDGVFSYPQSVPG